MSDNWTLHFRVMLDKRRTDVSHHPNCARAIEAASRLWRSGREPTYLQGPAGVQMEASELNAAIASLYALEMRCERCRRNDCNSLQRSIVNHGHLPWEAFLEKASIDCPETEDPS